MEQKKNMMRRNIDIKFSTSPRYISNLKKMLETVLGRKSAKTSAVYRNTAQLAMYLKEDIGTWLKITQPFTKDFDLVYNIRLKFFISILSP